MQKRRLVTWWHSDRNSPEWITERECVGGEREGRGREGKGGGGEGEERKASGVLNHKWMDPSNVGGCRYLKNNGQSFSLFDENYKAIEPRSLMNPKYKKHEENYTKYSIQVSCKQE